LCLDLVSLSCALPLLFFPPSSFFRVNASTACQSALALSGADLARVQAHIDEALKHSTHLQQLLARPLQAHAIPAERSVPPASFTSSLRPHTLVARVATLVFNSLRPHTQLKASGTSTYNIYVQKYTTKYSSLYISIGCLHLSAYCTEVQQSCNRAATELQQYQHIGCLHLSAYGAGERSPEALSY
jgi:hypothetical protein